MIVFVKPLLKKQIKSSKPFTPWKFGCLFNLHPHENNIILPNSYENDYVMTKNGKLNLH